MAKGIKPFRRAGHDYAEICHWQRSDGPQVIDVDMETFKPAEARRFAQWLLIAADAAESYNKKRTRRRSSSASAQGGENG